MTIKQRKGWLAAFLSLVSPPLGYAYNGKLLKGVVISLLLLLLYPALSLFAKVQVTRGLIIIAVLIPTIIVFSIAFDCYTFAKKQGQDYELKLYNTWWAYIFILIFISVLPTSIVTNYVRNEIVQAYKIPAGSMLPTLQIGDHLLVDKQAYREHPIQYGDIIVFSSPETIEVDYIKRVIALPGDSVEIRDKELIVNGFSLQEDYTIYTDSRAIPHNHAPRDNIPLLTVGPDHVFVLGDNRDNSFDSRFFGPVPIDTVQGKLVQIYWSWDDISGSVRWDRIGKLFETMKD